MGGFLKKTILFCIAVLMAEIIISMEWSLERDLSTGKIEALKVGIPEPYDPGVEILSIQEYQVEHPFFGFLWRPSIRHEDNVVIGWGDIPAGTIATDSIGFANSEDAIMTRESGLPVDIIGVGASYMGGTANLFHEYFSLNGYTYYNMAHGRFTLPQYNLALENYALKDNPQWVVYGLNEVSFTLIPDFEGWRESDMGWFDYHGGTWCGPPAKNGFPDNILKKYGRIYRVYQSVMKNLFRGALDKSPGRDVLIDKSVSYIKEAYEMCAANDIGFILLLIPSKVRMVQGPSPSLYMFEELVPELKDSGVPVIDLRESFRSVDDPSTLYFRQDAHWNRTGVYRAARELLSYIEKREKNDVESK